MGPSRSTPIAHGHSQHDAEAENAGEDGRTIPRIYLEQFERCPPKQPGEGAIMPKNMEDPMAGRQ
eukprot:11001636-Alexandrium_andersonii.AAC.1